MGLYRLERLSERNDHIPSVGSMIIGRGSGRSSSTLVEQAYEEHALELEQIKITGYKFLKPPGFSKTLKMVHEEQEYEQETASHTRDSFVSLGPNVTSEQTGDQSMENSLERPENEHEESVDAAFDFTPNISLPNASSPSLYLPPPDN